MSDIKSFAEGVEYIAKKVAESTPRDITQKGRITAIVGTGLYDVIINGKSYSSVPTYPSGSTSLAVNDMVWVMAPQGNYALMFIMAGGSGETPTPGTTDYNALSNKPSINSVTLSGNQTLSQLGIQPQGNYVVDTDYVHTDNNFTDTDVAKLSGIESGAEVNILETVQVNGTALAPTNKTVNVTVPTKTSDITNDSNFVVSTDLADVATSGLYGDLIGAPTLATTTTDGLMPATDKTKLGTIAQGAEVNQNAFSYVSVGGSTIVADSKTDTLSLTSSGIATLTPDVSTDTVNIDVTVPAEYVTDTEMQAYAQPIGDYATGTELSSGLSTKLNLSGGTMTGAIDMSNFAINNLPAATANQQPATFKQLNDAIAGLGTVFDLKGSVATYADLPTTGNVIGDVWYVEADSVGYIWLEDTTGTLRWEQFGPEIDLSGYLTKAGLLFTTGSATDNTMTQAAITDALGAKQNTSTAVTGVKGNSESAYRIGQVNITPTNIGLGNVNNTSDANKPISAATQTALNLKANTADLATVATTGQYSDLLGQPTIPSKTSDLTNDSGFITTIPTVTSTTNGLMFATDKVKLDGIAAGAEVNVNADWNAISGDAQILNKPTIPTNTSQLTNDSDFVQADDLALVATSGLYSDLTGKPTIPINGDFSLSGLSDTAIVTPANSQILQYNGIKWVNANPQSFSQQQANWNETNASSVQYIQNKPDLSLKANINSPDFTGVPTAPTAGPGVSTAQLATTAFVQNAVATIETTKVVVSSTQPTGLKDGDLWYQII